MVLSSGRPKPVLQRRSSVVNTLQAAMDGFSIIAIAWGLINFHFGGLTPEYTIFLLVLVGILAIVYDHFAIYRSNSSFTGKVLNIFNAWSISFLALFLIGFLTKQSEVYSRLLIGELYVLGFFAQCLLHLVVRMIHRGVMKHAQEPDKVIIVGQGRLASYLQHKISTNPWLAQRVIGTVNLSSQDSQADSPDGLSNLGDVNELPELIDKHSVSTVYIVTPLESSKVLENLYFTLLDRHVSIHWVPDIFSLRLINHSVREIAGIPVLTLSETPLVGLRLLMKKIEDIVLSMLILLLISPILAVVALLIKLDSPGPVFFRQDRAGWNGKTFKIWKFRSMYVQKAERGLVKQAEKNDPRITKIGAILRKTSIDELPQIFNVLTGDMSLVGPRPHAIQHDEEYSERITDYFARHNIKPGITGLAQVRGLRGETKEIDQMMKRVESDIEYINNWSVWLDLSILFRTFSAFTGKNAY